MMERQGAVGGSAAVNREMRRWIFDAAAWIVGATLALLLVAEATAGVGRALPPLGATQVACSACCPGLAQRGAADERGVCSPR